MAPLASPLPCAPGWILLEDALRAFGTTFVVLYLDHKTWQTGAQSEPTGGPHAVSNHHRRLFAEAGMAGRTQYAVGALEVEGRRTDPRQARRHHAGGEAAGGRRRRYRHRGRAGPSALRPRLSGEGRG